MSSGAPSQEEQLEAMRKQLTGVLESRDAELEKDFGPDAPHEEWARSLYQHQRTELLVPAVMRWYKDGPTSVDATTQAYIVGLVSQSLRRLAPEEAGSAAFRLMFFETVPKELILGVLRLAGGEATSEAFPRFADSLSKATRAAVEAGGVSQAAMDHISHTLGRLESLRADVRLEEEPLPQSDDAWAGEGFMQAAVGSTIGTTHALEAVPGIRDLTLHVPEELRSPDAEPEDLVQRARVYWVASALGHSQLLLGAFHATGDVALLRRLCDVLAPVGRGMLEGGDMPSDPTQPGGPAPGEEGGKRAVELAAGSMTLNALVEESHRHPAVFAAVAAELADLSEAVPEGAVRSRGAEARLAVLPQALARMASESLKAEERA